MHPPRPESIDPATAALWGAFGEDPVMQFAYLREPSGFAVRWSLGQELQGLPGRRPGSDCPAAHLWRMEPDGNAG